MGQPSAKITPLAAISTVNDGERCLIHVLKFGIRIALFYST